LKFDPVRSRFERSNLVRVKSFENVLPCRFKENSQEARTAAQKVTSIVIGMETNEITIQNPEEKLFTDGQDPINLTAWKRRMKEEPNLNVGFRPSDFLTKHFWQQHEVVVVYPYKVTILNIVGDGSRK
jgi:hypothetical protein